MLSASWGYLSLRGRWSAGPVSPVHCWADQKGGPATVGDADQLSPHLQAPAPAPHRASPLHLRRAAKHISALMCGLHRRIQGKRVAQSQSSAGEGSAQAVWLQSCSRVLVLCKKMQDILCLKQKVEVAACPAPCTSSVTLGDHSASPGPRSSICD